MSTAAGEPTPGAGRLREYPGEGAPIVLLHGGPGAPGHMAPVARELAGAHRVLEPFERRSGGAPLTVARHVEDLHALIRERCPGETPVLLGSSWGAMLALAFAAEHPTLARGLVLVGCGTFDEASRAAFRRALDRRLTPDVRRALDELAGRVADPDERLARRAELIFSAYAHDPLTADTETLACDARGHEETWADMLRLQREGVYPRAFSAVRAPVLMLHGDADPHPGRGIADSLRPFLPQLEYRELPRCGHYPWLERHARDPFYAILRAWLPA